ncbi:MAG: ECF transporter S component [Bacillota bacterium]
MQINPRQLAIAGLLGALVVVLGMTPIGFVPVPGPAGRATTMHIPVILAGIFEGPVVGATVGLLFGLFSYVRNAMAPANPVAAMMFADPLVTFVPRILIGVVAYYAYTLVRARHARPLVTAAVPVIVADGLYRVLKPLAAAQGTTGIIALFGGLAASPVGLWLMIILVAGGLAYLVWRLTGGDRAAPGLAAIAGTAANTIGVLGLSVIRGYLPAGAAWAVGILHGLPEILVALALVLMLERAIKGALRN